MFVSVTHLRYQLTTGNIGGVFDVNNETGEIKVQGELDYDEGIQVNFFVIDVKQCLVLFMFILLKG